MPYNDGMVTLMRESDRPPAFLGQNMEEKINSVQDKENIFYEVSLLDMETFIRIFGDKNFADHLESEAIKIIKKWTEVNCAKESVGHRSILVQTYPMKENCWIKTLKRSRGQSSSTEQRAVYEAHLSTFHYTINKLYLNEELIPPTMDDIKVFKSHNNNLGIPI